MERATGTTAKVRTRGLQVRQRWVIKVLGNTGLEKDNSDKLSSRGSHVTGQKHGQEAYRTGMLRADADNFYGSFILSPLVFFFWSFCHTLSLSYLSTYQEFLLSLLSSLFISSSSFLLPHFLSLSLAKNVCDALEGRFVLF